VTDIYGNPVPEAKVSFSVKSGTVTPSRAVSDAKGKAALTWKLGSKPGEQTLVGVVRGSDVTGEYVTQVGGREPVAKPASIKAASVKGSPVKAGAVKTSSIKTSSIKTASIKTASLKSASK